MNGFCGPAAVLIVVFSTLASAGEFKTEPISKGVVIIQPVSLNVALDAETEREQGKKVEPSRLTAQPKIETSTRASEKTKKPARRKPLRRRVLVIKASWCGACQSLNSEWPRLRKVRWRIGSDDTDHFQLIDVDASPNAVSRYDVTQLPTLLLVEDGKVIQRTGSLDAKNLAEFYYGRY